MNEKFQILELFNKFIKNFTQNVHKNPLFIDKSNIIVFKSKSKFPFDRISSHKITCLSFQQQKLRISHNTCNYRQHAILRAIFAGSKKSLNIGKNFQGKKKLFSKFLNDFDLSWNFFFDLLLLIEEPFD